MQFFDFYDDLLLHLLNIMAPLTMSTACIEKSRWFLFFFSFFLIFHMPSVSASDTLQSSVRIPISDPIYRVIDQMVSFGLCAPPLYGVRPWGNRDIQSILSDAREASKKKQDISTDFAQAAQDILRQERIRELWRQADVFYVRWGRLDAEARYRVDILRQAAWDGVYSDAQPHAFVNNGLGVTPAAVEPYSDFRQGRSLVKGFQYKWETSHGFQLSPYASGYFQPYFYFQFPEGNASSRIQASVHELYSRVVWHNVALQVGRGALQLGQGEHGGFLLTDNARPLDGIQLMNDRPLVLPSILKHLGKTRWLFHIETLGPDYAFKNSLFSGLKAQMQPFGNWEVGFGYSTIFGGEGASTPDSVGDYLQDYFGFIPFVSSTSNTFSNRIFELDTRITLRKHRGAQIYAEMALDDKTFESVKSTLRDRSAYMLGFYLPRLNDAGTADLRFEWRFVSEMFYRHNSFPYVLNGHILGDPLGSDGMSASLGIGYAVNGRTRVANRVGLELRDSDTYRFAGDTIDRTVDNPQEVFLSWRPSLVRDITDTTALSLDFGYTRAFNAAYVSGNNENQLFFGFSLSKAFPSFTVGLK